MNTSMEDKQALLMESLQILVANAAQLAQDNVDRKGSSGTGIGEELCDSARTISRDLQQACKASAYVACVAPLCHLMRVVHGSQRTRQRFSCLQTYAGIAFCDQL
jgi:hypothetical protein